MKIVANKKCIGCNVCSSVCPNHCISMREAKDGFEYPIIDKRECLNCKACINTCPVVNATEQKNSLSLSYAAYSKDEAIRMQSSSGGLFYCLAEKIIELGGVVFGATFDRDNRLVHRSCDHIDGLKSFCGSKYVQSHIGDCYYEAEKYLKDSRTVYYSGTPCQISALKHYLRKPYDNLITQDIICHGVPSPLVLKKYLNKRQSEVDSRTEMINFRNKDSGWEKYSITIGFEDDSTYQCEYSRDAYMLAFLKNLSLRESCYHCSFRSKKRESDITLGDFWGINNILPQMNDDKGTSFIIINSEIGKKLFDLIDDNIIFQSVDLDEALAANPSMTASVYQPIERSRFFRDIVNADFDYTVRKYLHSNMISKIIRKINRKLTQ